MQSFPAPRRRTPNRLQLTGMLVALMVALSAGYGVGHHLYRQHVLQQEWERSGVAGLAYPGPHTVMEVSVTPTHCDSNWPYSSPVCVGDVVYEAVGTDARPEAVFAWYRDQLTRRGWTVYESGTDAERLQMIKGCYSVDVDADKYSRFPNQNEFGFMWTPMDCPPGASRG